MGVYINIGNEAFEKTINTEIYVDKTNILSYTNKVLDSSRRWICVSRPRRFGKSITAEMLSAYYDKSCDSHSLFKNFKISKSCDFEQYINKFNVIHIDIQWIKNSTECIKIVETIQKSIISELKELYPEFADDKCKSLPLLLANIHNKTKNKFIIIIDEWDCIFREDKNNKKAQEEYIQLLNGLFKGSQPDKFISLAYLTGILPIKKYGTQSALNNFEEFTMEDPAMLAEYVGFTEDEVKKLCEHYNMSFEEAEKWYDGYSFYSNKHIYSPKSITDAMSRQRFNSYWTKTETYESLKYYITMNFDGLKDDIIRMLSGDSIEVDTSSFQNDMTTFNVKDDVLTLLIHLGYLAYDSENEKVYIPNYEVMNEFKSAIKGAGWSNVYNAIKLSDKLLEETILGNNEFVAETIDSIHIENSSILNYNNENSLSCIISLAYYSAKKYYKIIREMPAGKGFADILFLPLRNTEKPPIIIELKWDKNIQTSISQIKEKKYLKSVDNYDEILLVGISYDKKIKKHKCAIEKVKIERQV